MMSTMARLHSACLILGLFLACSTDAQQSAQNTSVSPVTTSSGNSTVKKCSTPANKPDIRILGGLFAVAAVLLFAVMSLCILVVKRWRNLKDQAKKSKVDEQATYEELDEYLEAGAGKPGPYITVMSKKAIDPSATVPYETVGDVGKRTSTSPPIEPPPPQDDGYLVPEDQKADKDVYEAVDNPSPPLKHDYHNPQRQYSSVVEAEIYDDTQ